MTKIVTGDLPDLKMDTLSEDGKIEADDNALVSIGDEDGAYVMVWHWVNAAAADIEDSENRVDSEGESPEDDDRTA